MRGDVRLCGGADVQEDTSGMQRGEMVEEVGECMRGVGMGSRGTGVVN